MGNKILELRKQNHMSQEQLAEKIGVARQTISKWELGETSPDIEQSKKLAQIFQVSLDELVQNNMVSKNSNKIISTKLILNILKIILLIIVICLLILVATIYFKDYFDVHPTSTGKSITCQIDNQEYTYEVWTKYETPNIIENFYTNDEEMNLDITKYNSMDKMLEDVENSVISRGGTCIQ